MNKIKNLLFISLIFTTSSTLAREPWRDAVHKPIDPTIAALSVPPFCEGISGIHNIPTRHKNINWTQKFGGDMVWINHYCDQKPKIPICFQYPEAEKRECLISMLEGTTYILNHAQNPDFALIPFLRSERGVLLKDIGKYPEAIADFEFAIKKNPRFIPAYIGLVDTYKKIKQYDNAKQVLERALHQNPKNKSLLKKLARINALKQK